jgi:hypothetical protein
MTELIPGFAEALEKQVAERIEEQVAIVTAHYEESLDRLEGMMDRGWIPIYGNYDEQDGPTLSQIKEAAKRNREMILNPHVANGLELINSYVWGDGIHYDGIPGARQGRGTNVQAIIDNATNQKNFFGQLARKQRQATFYFDGICLMVGVDATDSDPKTVVPLSITQVTDDYRDPDNFDEIWAFRRTWTRRVRKNGQTQKDTKSEWIFTNEHYGKLGDQKTITYNGKAEPIARNKRIFWKKSNPIAGWAYGVSDVQRGISWAEDYRQALYDGKKMNSSLASIWATAKHNSEQGASTAALQLGRMPQAGGLAHMGQNNALQVLPTAGTAYDFAKLLPMLAAFAAGIGVSATSLSMNSGNAGGSYGSAKALDRPEQLSTKMRREYNKELDIEVLKWLGAPADKVDVWFDPIIDPTEKYRAEQIVELRLGTGLYKGEDIKKMHAILDGRDPEKVGPVPDGWLIPNNRESIELRTIDPNTSGTAGGNPSNGGSFAPTQGSGAKSNPAGSGDQKADDIRTNREMLEEFLREDRLDELMQAIRELNGKLDKQ